MQLIDGRPVYSATDLVGFLACEHLTQLERAALQGLVQRPQREDIEIDLIAKRGYEHEQRFLVSLRDAGRQVTEIVKDESITDRGWQLRHVETDTIAAMQRGDDVIFQATFFDGTWIGYADFLLRVPAASDLGDWSYEVADTKLARKPKAGAILQMCSYTEQVHRIQGTWPTAMHVALGGVARQTASFRVNDAMAYYRNVKDRFRDALNSGTVAYPPGATYPEPVEHCKVCRWVVECVGRRHRDDHLSLVANISTRQRKALVERGVSTLASLGTLPLPMEPRLEGTSPESLTRVREQARLQAQGRSEGRVLHELLQPIEAGRGLAALPPPSAGDLFFDMEGDPFVEEGGADGLEYLFGVIEPAAGTVDRPAFHAFLGLDRAGEKRAFEEFIDLVMDRLDKDPDLHVYHYASYEPSAVKRLMGRHATREEEVDRLLRGKVFVDLYSVVKQGVRVSQDSYSIKKLEPLYGLIREVDLKDAGSSIVNFELWLDGGGTDQALLEQIREYNRDDCISTLRLRDWLEERRVQAEQELGVAVPRPEAETGAPSEDLTRDRAEVQALVQHLTRDLPPDGERSPEQHATWLLAQLLDWHRREDKSIWWEYFRRMKELTEEELVEDRGPIANMTYEAVVGQVKRSLVHRYRFPPQEHEIRAGMGVDDPATGESAGTVEAIEDETGTVDIKRSKKSTTPHPTAIVPLQYVRAKAQHESLMRIGYWVADNGIDAPGPYRAARDLLLRRLPQAGQVPGSPLAVHGEDLLEAARQLAVRLDCSVLPIQGPPGSGKTYTGARMIAALVEHGKQVGITANSHRVIGNLLKCIFRAGQERGLTVTAMQKAEDDDRWDPEVAPCTDSNEELRDALATREAMVGAGTAWVWAREDFKESVDVLFVDEAGQMSLANAVAVAAAAKSVVLLGDPAQLEQPVKGSHPPGAEVSALEHLLAGAQTMPPERGLFLEKTWRLHPDLCRFTSEVFYEGRLEPEDHLAVQDVDAPGGELTGAGLRWIPVAHEGNQNDSPEEAREVRRLAEGLVGARWTDEKGRTRPLDWTDILFVAPYNAQVKALADVLPPGTRVGTVDKFQGQEAPVVFYSMATSSAELAPRGMDFLYSLNRLNVATSRARGLAVVVGSPELLKVRARTPAQIRLANALCRAVELGQQVDLRVPIG